LRSTAGIIFLGTPLRGTKAKKVAEWSTFISGIIGKDDESSTTLVEDLAANSSNLESLIEDFGKLTIKYGMEIRCFYETRKTQVLKAVFNPPFLRLVPSFTEILVGFSESPGNPLSSLTVRKLVDKSSACLDCHEHVPLDARHAMMNKFRGPLDANFTLVSGRIRDIFQKVQTVQHQTSENRKCIQSLASNYREHKDRNQKRVPETCEWLLRHQMFLSWRNEEKANLLLVSADPGAGKSVLSRALVDEGLLSHDISDTKMRSICYFFFKDDDAERRSGANALRAILHQLFTQRPVLLKHAMPDFDNHGEKLCDMFGILWDILMKSTADPDAGQVICVLDALDECEESARKDLIQKLGGFYLARQETKANLKFFVTSRAYYNIKRAFKGKVNDLPSINLSGEEESLKISKEIDLVIMHEVPRIAQARDPPLGEKVQQGLVEHLKNMNNRTYLWLHLILDVIQRSLESSEPKLKRLLGKIPPSVDAAYEQILNRITDPGLVEQARRLLHMVVVAERPLTLQETNIALAIMDKNERGESCNSENDLELDSQDAFKIKVRNLCGLFVSIIDSKIYLIHQTAKEFLVKRNDIANVSSHAKAYPIIWRYSMMPEESNLVLAKACISYLLLNEFKYFPLEWKAVFGTIHEKVVNQYTNKHSFLDYAARHWAFHIRQARGTNDTAVLNASLNLCNTQSERFHTWFLVFWIHYVGYCITPKFTDLIVGSFLGLEAEVKLLLEHKVDIDATEDLYRSTALYWAARNGHVAVVQLLLEKGADVEVKDIDGDTALHRPAWNGHEAVVQLLLKKGVDIEAKDIGGHTALHGAVHNGHEAVVRLLLEKGVGVEVKNNNGDTALHQAAWKGHEAVVRLLLEKGVDVEVKNNNGDTALHQAAWKGHEAVVRLLLENGADKEGVDDQGGSVLHLAARGGNINVINLLIDLGLDINAKDKRGECPLHYAASGGSLQAVERILQLDPIIYADSVGWSPLHWAARSGNLQLFKLLREAGVAESTRDTLDPPCSWNSLNLAGFHGNESLAKYIMTLVDDIANEHSTATVRGEQPPMDDSLPILADILSPIKGDKHGLYWCSSCFNVSLLKYDML
jgi:ankyrin repeat protein